MNCVIIAAGGKGTRFSGDVCKQRQLLKARPLVAWSIAPFETEDRIAQIVLVYPSDEEEASYRKIMESERFRKVRLVPGGESRFDSVRHGFLALPACEIVLIHDAARPLVTNTLVSKVLLKAQESGAAIPALRVSDTVKRVDQDQVLQTLPRDVLYLAQTPQAFRYEILKKAYDEIGTSYAASSWTDEAMMVEELGFPVAIVPGEKRNVKITDPEDLRFAEFLLRQE
jgi:2-C-methyl-D-erythritol 4-phosphate cytidylyltransferase